MIKLLGIPYDKNSSFVRGPALAPPKIREMDKNGSANRFSELGIEIVPGVNYTDLGDINCVNDDPETAFNKIMTTTLKHLNHDGKIISIGGDHSVAFPVIAAHAMQYEDLNVLQIDAHADLYDNFGDNPYSHASPFARLLEKGSIASLIQVGIRTMTSHLHAQVERFGVRCIEMKNFNLDFLSEIQGPLYISLDLDALDPAYAPGVSHHEPGGLSTRDVIDIIHGIKVEIIGADIVELNPHRDLNDMTAMLAYKLFKEICSKMLNE